MDKYYIDYKLLEEQPFDPKNEGSIDIHEEDNRKLENIKNELIYGSHSCYMVSGFRGSGKTSYLNKLESIVNKNSNNIVFIRVNFVSGDEKQIF